MTKTTLSQAHQVLNLIAQSDIERSQFQELLESGKLTELLQEFMKNAEFSDPFMVTVIYNFKEMIEAGKYDWLHDELSEEHYPVEPREPEEVELHLVHFGHDMTTDGVMEELDKRGMRIATLPELCALGTAKPEWQRDFPIVALGSEWQDPGDLVCIPFLVGVDGRRYLDLDWVDSDGRWSVNYRFVAASK